jgi:hypothetical protein
MATTTMIAIPLDREVKQRLERAARPGVALGDFAAALLVRAVSPPVGVPANTDEPEATGPGETPAILLNTIESARFVGAILDPPPPGEV